MQIVEADSLLWCHPLLTYKIVSLTLINAVPEYSVKLPTY